MSDFTIKLPKHLYTAAQVQSLDRIAIEEFSIPGFELMQTAAAATFNMLREKWPQTRHLLIFVGAGNNGGDGYAIARLAKEAGLTVDVINLTPVSKLKGDARLAFESAAKLNVPLHEFSESESISETDHAHTVIIDALLGTGVDREVSGNYKQAIERINSMACPVVAVDIPSGLCADTGKKFGSAVEADLTVSFIGMKQGLLTAQGRDFAGEVIFDNLDVPDAVYSHASAPAPSSIRFDINDATRHLLPRQKSSHKGSHGHVMVMGGDYSYGGATLMAAEAAQRSGAGLVSVVTRSQHRPAILARRPELMVLGTEDESYELESLVSRASVILIGPGLGKSQWSRKLLQQALSAQQANNTPLVVDADGLNLLAERLATGVPLNRKNWILTPHPGEAASLLDCSVANIQENRFSAIKNLAETWGGACLLKGSGSLICSGNNNYTTFLSTEGNAGMATGGMGDVLAGITASLLGQGLDLLDALRCAVAIHGEAADLAVAECGERGLAATDLFPFIRQLVNPSLH